MLRLLDFRMALGVREDGSTDFARISKNPCALGFRDCCSIRTEDIGGGRDKVLHTSIAFPFWLLRGIPWGSWGWGGPYVSHPATWGSIWGFRIALFRGLSKCHRYFPNKIPTHGCRLWAEPDLGHEVRELWQLDITRTNTLPPWIQCLETYRSCGFSVRKNRMSCIPILKKTTYNEKHCMYSIVYIV